MSLDYDIPIANNLIKEKVSKAIKNGKNKEWMISNISKDKNLTKFSEKGIDVERMIANAISEHASYEECQKVIRSNIIFDISSKRSVLYDPVTRQILPIMKERLKDMFDQKFIDEVLSFKISFCTFQYAPNIPQLTFTDKEYGKIFNTYKPPFWLSDYFFSNGKTKISKVDKIPELYDRFLRHLTDGKMESYEYVLDWIATAMRSRNYCYLIAIGDQGIGKGVLGSIMRELVGASNYNQTTVGRLTNNFNASIADRKIIEVEEFSVNNKKTEDLLKILANDMIEVEKKGIDATYGKNQASFFFTSNNLDAIRLTEDDRRYSIIDLTDKKLPTVFSKEEIASLMAPENISNLASFLYYREVDENKMLKVFKSLRTEIVKENSLLPWEEYLIYEYRKTLELDTASLPRIRDDVYSKFKTRLSRPMIEKLCKSRPDIFRIKRTGTKTNEREWILEYISESSNNE